MDSSSICDIFISESKPKFFHMVIIYFSLVFKLKEEKNKLELVFETKFITFGNIFWPIEE